VELIRRADGVFVEANLYHRVKPPDLVVVEREWGPVRSLVMQALLHGGVQRRQWPQAGLGARFFTDMLHRPPCADFWL
jgi:hypothetical protein